MGTSGMMHVFFLTSWTKPLSVLACSLPSTPWSAGSRTCQFKP